VAFPGARPVTLKTSVRCPAFLADLPARLTGAGAPPAYAAVHPHRHFAGDWPGAVLGDSEAVPPTQWPSADVHTLTVVGKVGAGKTWLATALLGLQILRGRRCLWRDLSELLADAKTAYGRDDLPDPIAEVTEFPGPVLLDDLNAEFRTEWARGETSRMIRHRMRYQIPTCLTLSLSLAELSALDPGLSSRLSGQAIVDLGAVPDRRRQR
jgi:hypothetical protein